MYVTERDLIYFLVGRKGLGENIIKAIVTSGELK
jgi:hypothetical protein